MLRKNTTVPTMFKKFKKLFKKHTPEEEAEYFRQVEEQNLDGKDRFAMFVSAFLVIVLPCLLILLGICLIAMLVFGVL